MELIQNSIVVVKNGDLLCIFYNGGHHTKVKKSINMLTKEHVTMLKDDKGVLSNLFSCSEEDVHTHNMFDTVNGISINDNETLFNELEKEL